MSIKVFTMPVNNSGKVEFTRQDLEKLLNDVYNEGYRQGEADAKGNYWTWCPTITSAGSTSTSNAIQPGFTYLSNSTATDPTNAVTDTLEMKAPTINTSFSINGEKIDLSTSGQTKKNEGFRIEPLSPEELKKLSATFAKQDDVWNRLARELGGL